ncbi:hypothetical protein BH09PSE4_BH09PSE4_14360 [soil metagenome]
MKISGLSAIGLGLALGACATTTPTARPGRAPFVPIPSYSGVGLDRVMGHNAQVLIAMMGQPDADIREGAARKLQFEGAFCVLDAYLYAPPQGGDPVVSYLDAREPDGSTIDRASCVAALTRRDGGK